MRSDEYDGLMRPWYGLNLVETCKATNQLGASNDIESVEAFEFSPILPRSTSLDGNQSSALLAFENLQETHNRDLIDSVLARVHCLTHVCFEHLILDVVRAAGFASDRPDLAHKVGRTGDGGIDGIINLDDFGLDAIYLQAKRLRPGAVVGAAAVRDFIGSLETHRASKAVFVTTGDFSQLAREVVKNVSSRVVLINGEKLATLLIKHGVGLKKVKTFVFQQVDTLWFKQTELDVQNSC